MTKIFDVINEGVYNSAVEAGYIKTQTHPEVDGLTVHNYTDPCTWEQAWNEATLNCRGLITDVDGNIVARGMPKFFNSDQEQAPKFALEDEVIVSDKMDGSLGILYTLPDGAEAIATRGSFASEQAIWATKWWNESDDRPEMIFEDGFSYVFEIIFPANRIVVDYGDVEGLFLLGKVENATGKFFPLDSGDVEKRANRFDYRTWAEVLTAPERPNAEGFVVVRPSDGAMVKIKYEDYKRLHKYMTRVTERHVWETLVAGLDLEQEFAGAPDEFHDWVKDIAADLSASFNTRIKQIVKDYEVIRFSRNSGLIPESFELGSVGEREARKNFALAIKDCADKSYYFSLYDGREIVSQVWKELRPEAKTFRIVSSDAD